MTDIEDPVTEEQYSSWALFILVGLLLVSLFSGDYLQRRQIRAVHESVVSIFAGMAVGLAVRVSPGERIQEKVSFHYGYFFNLLLPPIILHSGFEMRQAHFFRSLAPILTFALVGTFISAVVTGVLVYLWGLSGAEDVQLSFVEAMSVGATLSATDPVTVLSILKQCRIDETLYAIVAGESLLNDAVAIVMFETLQQFHGRAIDAKNIAEGILLFVLNFCGSLLVGVIAGAAAALLLKQSTRSPQSECCLVLLLAHSAYFFANGCRMSGIVALLFCGITAKRYACPNMTRPGMRMLIQTLSVLANLAESIVFVSLGVSLFTQAAFVYRPLFAAATTASVLAARYAAVFPLAALLNRFCSANIPRHHQTLLFWAGLRGAVGVALSASLPPSLRATVLVVVVLTVVVLGGTAPRILDILADDPVDTRVPLGIVHPDSDSDSDSDPHQTNLQNVHDSAWFRDLDSLIKPVLINQH